MIRREGVPLDPRTLCPVIEITRPKQALRTTPTPTFLPPVAVEYEVEEEPVQSPAPSKKPHFLARLLRRLG